MDAVAAVAIPCVGCVDSGGARHVVADGNVVGMALIAVPGLIAGAMAGFSRAGRPGRLGWPG
ncbi:hypothetical protein [Actinospica robiniae]|uniref:hypothetical protein n=1 Tax=Actinospica robiniae TaxID=304901 RepID=UPI000415B32F|nr:hypothetical protein [Actinospica robiniae]